MRKVDALPPLAAALMALSACSGGNDCGPAGPVCVPANLPSISVADVSVAEGTGGTVDALFVVTLSAAPSTTVTVNYATADGSASAPDDYQATAGTLVFATGQTQGSITVPVVSDIVGEGASETFTLTLTFPTLATLANATATGTIIDDDACDALGTVAPGESVVGTLSASDCTRSSATDYFDMWLWSQERSSLVAIDLTSQALDFDPHLEVFELDGDRIGQDAGGGYDVNARMLISAEPGTFAIYAGAASAGETGDYHLTVTEVPVDAEFFASTSGGNGTNASTLHSLDPSTGAAMLVGPIGFDRVGAISFHPTTDVLYGVGRRSGGGAEVLMRVNPSTGVGTEIGPTGLVGGLNGSVAGMAFRADGTLFLYSSEHDLYTANLATGTATLVGATGNPPSGGNGIAFSEAGVLFHSNRDESHTLNTSTGAASYQADMDFPVPCEDVSGVLSADARISGVDRPTGFAEFYGIVKCAPGAVDPSTYLGQVDFETGYVIIIGQSADDLDGFAIRN